MREGVEVINCEWAMVNGDLVNGHLREIFPVFPVNGEWAMVNGESSVILLLLNYYASSSITLSVISYPFFSYPLFSYPLFSYPFFSYQLFSSLIQVHSIILARF